VVQRHEITERDVAAIVLVLMVLAGGRPVYKAAQAAARAMPLPENTRLADFVKALRGCTPFCLEASNYLAVEAEEVARHLAERSTEVFAAVLTARKIVGGAS